MAIDGRVNGNGGYAHFFAGAEDAQRNFSSVGNQNLRKAHVL
jgi:hypothetical protein